jgi:aryl-alcohol dehydrogenase-like predicted oxidoreductase
MQRLGSTPLVVSRLGLGLAALGRPAYITPGRWRDFGADRSVANLERRCHEMLDAAYAAGIRYVDAARSYGMAENFLGTWLRARNLSTDAITVGSKWGHTYVGSWRVDAQVHEVKDLSLDTLRRQIAESRALVGDCLQLYQIHSATLESKVLENVDVLRELLRLRGSGLGIGLTVTGPNQADVIRRALRVSIDGVNPFQVVQATGICSSHQRAPPWPRHRLVVGA